ncbi:MAG: NAD(P)/FAD-dependent oxidoreductase [Candidatus Omnitrophica bacterium]|nr:NAD(P)/FAD-dependent oxidoreductase [Candidatus Omnitrophota bacterium]
MLYDCIIIGAGTGGLVPAVKLAAAGRKVLVLEKQPLPGGLGTTFTRRGFTFESALHCVDALAEGGEVRRFLQEYGLDNGLEFIPLKDFCRIRFPEHDFVADFDPGHYKDYLKKSFPHQAEELSRLFCGLKDLYRQFDRYADSKLPEWLNLALAPILYPGIIRASCLTAESFLKKYISDKKLTAILTEIWRFIGSPPSRLSAFYFLVVFRGYYFEPTVYCRGGFIRIFRAMTQRIEELGGEVRFNTEVKKIVTARSGACGVVTAKGEEFRARTVISNANAIDTLCTLLDDGELKKDYARRLAAMEKSVSALQIYLGLNVPAKSLGMEHFMLSVCTGYDHDEGFGRFMRGDYEHSAFSAVDHAQLDPGLTPPGKGSLLIMSLDNFANWAHLNGREYAEKKVAVAGRLIRRLEKYLPGLSETIEVMEVATPKTMQRFGTLPEGAIYGFAQTVNQASINRLAQSTRVRGLFLSGAWTRPGCGMHGALVSGKDAADLALRSLK